MGFFPKITNPLCVVFGHNFIQRGGKTYCSHCGKKI